MKKLIRKTVFCFSISIAAGVHASEPTAWELAETLEENVEHGCPIAWDKSTVISKSIDYTGGTDIWQADLHDNARYIRFLLENEADPTFVANANAAGVIFNCKTIREDHLQQLYAATESSFNAVNANGTLDSMGNQILGADGQPVTNVLNLFQDADSDGVNNYLDLCGEAIDPNLVNSNGAAEVADANGCSPSQRDADGDGVFDGTDMCLSTPPSSFPGLAANGCTDIDGDGITDDVDPYPYQSAVQCLVPSV